MRKVRENTHLPRVIKLPIISTRLVLKHLYVTIENILMIIGHSILLKTYWFDA